MKKVYLSPRTNILKSGSKYFILDTNIYEGSKESEWSNGDVDGYSKDRGGFYEDASSDDKDLWSTNSRF